MSQHPLCAKIIGVLSAEKIYICQLFFLLSKRKNDISSESLDDKEAVKFY